jgi:hypothetical protein
MELVFRDYWWLEFLKYVKEFVRFCENPCHYLRDLFQPLPILASLRSSISMDFITDLSPSNFYDSILMVVDHLTKMVHFIPFTKTIIGK